MSTSVGKKMAVNQRSGDSFDEYLVTAARKIFMPTLYGLVIKNEAVIFKPKSSARPKNLRSFSGLRNCG